ncbi:MAG: hypothetical protein IT381_27760 [Deltaproteobacteria bacterium]|nr:hypothetical protein [Deltaproteobacteria bacterium]
MRLTLVTLCLFIVACPQAQPGATGNNGTAGSTGPTGPQGAPGTCDTMSCPSVASIDGLAGGSVSGTSTFDNAVVSTTLTSQRLVFTRGSKSTTVNGFFCGYTSFKVDGRAFRTGATGGTEDRSGPWAAKKWCQEACGNSPTAHVCTVQELVIAQDLRGGSDKTSADSVEGDNPDVPMPPFDPVPADVAFQRGWVRSLDGVSSCRGFRTSTGNGVVFRPDGDPGSFESVPCTEDHPLFCCN